MTALAVAVAAIAAGVAVVLGYVIAVSIRRRSLLQSGAIAVAPNLHPRCRCVVAPRDEHRGREDGLP